MRQRDGRRAFSLIELLITIGIIAVLLAILMPIISRVRGASRTTVCLANLQQWGAAYQLYVNANRGQTMQLADVNHPNYLEWWESLSGYSSKRNASILCPEATDRPAGTVKPHKYIEGSAHTAWNTYHAGGENLGSYGLNVWIYSFPANFAVSQHPYLIHFPAKQPDRVPLLGDCIAFRSHPFSTDGVPANLEFPVEHDTHSLGVGDFCINRHAMAVNIVFVDGHAETVPLAGLWKLRWSENFKPKDVTIVSP